MNQEDHDLSTRWGFSIPRFGVLSTSEVATKGVGTANTAIKFLPKYWVSMSCVTMEVPINQGILVQFLTAIMTRSCPSYRMSYERGSSSTRSSQVRFIREFVRVKEFGGKRRCLLAKWRLFTATKFVSTFSLIGQILSDKDAA